MWGLNNLNAVICNASIHCFMFASSSIAPKDQIR